MHFQNLVLSLQKFWSEQGCLLAQSYDLEKGAATFNPSTFLRSLGPEPFNAAFIEPCRRPKDGRYGENPNRMQHYYQFQVVMKPNPANILELYLSSLKAIGINPLEHDIRFVHDDWESPTLGAWGLGWEVWLDGMEITQFTYFQQVGGIDLSPVTGEITYGLERICMYLQKKNNVFQLSYNDQFTYGDIFHLNEVQYSQHNFEFADTDLHFDLFNKYEAECKRLMALGVVLPAYDYCIKASHAFNLLDARGAISVNERQGYILRVRALAKLAAEAWIKTRESMGYPLMARSKPLVAPLGASIEGFKPLTANVTAERAPLLIELGVEEMPARVFGPLHRELPALVQKHFADSQLDLQDIKIFASPRRITISVSSLRLSQPDLALDLKGPPAQIAKNEAGWTKAALAFAQKNQIDLATLEIRKHEGGEYVFAKVERKGRSAVDLLAEIIPKILGEIHWYKTMRWGEAKEMAFVRPVQWLVGILGNDILPLQFAGLKAGAVSFGHRFLHAGPVAVSSDREKYLKALRNAKVIVDQEERKSIIRASCKKTAEEKNWLWKEDEELLEQVAYLVEFPVPVLGSFEKNLLAIPAEVLISEMREHQKYFAVTDMQGDLVNAFITLSNMVCEDYALIREGNEKVIRARFADAEFFLKEDKQRTLQSRLIDLDKITFLADLGSKGSIGEKVKRVQVLAEFIGEKLGLDAEALGRIKQIAILCKCDLTTQMVGEFPELQGIVGRYYALAEGLDTSVANGIRDHYLPRNANDTYPENDEGAIVGIADRIDTLMSMFSKGKVPTGSADPYALRRACWSCVAIMLHRKFDLNILDILKYALVEVYREEFQFQQFSIEKKGNLELFHDLQEFFFARTKFLLQEIPRADLPGGFAKDIVEAAAQSTLGWHDLLDFVARTKALQEFRQHPDFMAIAETFKRVNNILKGEVMGVLNPETFQLDVEKNLYKTLAQIKLEMDKFLEKKDYLHAFTALVSLRADVQALFEGAMINDPAEAVRLNRQLLLQEVRGLVMRMADFSAITIG